MRKDVFERVALFHEVCDGGHVAESDDWWGDDDDEVSQGGNPRGGKRVKLKDRDQVHPVWLVCKEGAAKMVDVANSFVSQVGAECGETEYCPGLDYVVKLSEIRAKSDLSLYKDMRELEADMLMLLLKELIYNPNAQLQQSCSKTLLSMAGVISNHGGTPTTASLRLSGKQLTLRGEKYERECHVSAQVRLLQQFSLLDQNRLFGEDGGVPNTGLKAPMTVQEMMKNVKEGVYDSDIDFVVDLRVMFLNAVHVLPPGSSDREEALRLLERVTPCTTDAGLQPYCADLPPPPPTTPHLTPSDVRFITTLSTELATLDKPTIITTPCEAPHYRQSVRRPMDLTTINLKLRHHLYPSRQTAIEDFYLIAENCKAYHKEPECQALAREVERVVTGAASTR